MGGGGHFVKSFMNLEHLKSSFDPIDLQAMKPFAEAVYDFIF